MHGCLDLNLHHGGLVGKIQNRGGLSTSICMINGGICWISLKTWMTSAYPLTNLIGRDMGKVRMGNVISETSEKLFVFVRNLDQGGQCSSHLKQKNLVTFSTWNIYLLIASILRSISAYSRLLGFRLLGIRIKIHIRVFSIHIYIIHKMVQVGNIFLDRSCIAFARTVPPVTKLSVMAIATSVSNLRARHLNVVVINYLCSPFLSIFVKFYFHRYRKVEEIDHAAGPRPIGDLAYISSNMSPMFVTFQLYTRMSILITKG